MDYKNLITMLESAIKHTEKARMEMSTAIGCGSSNPLFLFHIHDLMQSAKTQLEHELKVVNELKDEYMNHNPEDNIQRDMYGLTIRVGDRVSLQDYEQKRCGEEYEVLSVGPMITIANIYERLEVNPDELEVI